MNPSAGMNKKTRIDFNHYINLLLGKKWWIIIIAVVISAAWFLVVPGLLEKDKEFDFTAMIRFDDPRSRSRAGTIDEGFLQLEAESKSELIRTTPFLNEVIDSLNLNVISSTRGLSREAIFSDIMLEKSLKYGLYTVKHTNGNLDIYYTNKREGKENVHLENYHTLNDSIIQIEVSGLHATLNLKPLRKLKEIHYSIIPAQPILNALKSNLNFRLNLRATLLTINYRANDHILGAKTLNAIVDLFLEKSMEFKQSRTLATMEALEEQLDISKQELEAVEQQLQNYRERNPNIYLSENLTQINESILTSSMERDQIDNSLRRLNRLVEERNSAGSETDKSLIYQELIGFLNEQNIAGITAIEQQYNELINQRNELQANNFSMTHPRMTEVTANIRTVEHVIDERITQYRNEKTERLATLDNTIENSERRIRLSPGRERQLAKLQREREAKAQVYTNVLVRYNEIKTAHASITPDAYLLEHAQVPIVYSGGIIDLIIKLIIFIMGPFLGVGLAGALFIGLDFVWHKARSVDDIEDRLNLNVIATIPKIKNNGTAEDVNQKGKKLDPMLITVDYTPNAAAEAFRNLRTKTLLSNETETCSKFLITSLMPGEGKSFVSENLAVTYAQLKEPTLLIDCDMRRGVLHNSLQCEKKPGLSEFLAKVSKIDDEAVGKIIQQTTIPNLFLLSTGDSVPNPTELLISKKFGILMEKLEKHFKYIVVDTPPIEYIPDALVLYKHIPSLIIVTRYGLTDINRLKRKLSEFSEVREGIKGIVLNDSLDSKHKQYNAYSYYKY